MPDDSQTNLAALAEKLGVTFGDPAILQEALTHSSFVHERGLAPGADYERLEFLGDAVLDLAVSHLLMFARREEPVGDLTKLRASIVNRKTLAQLARRLGLSEHIRLSRGEIRTAGREKSSILADVFEAIIGAIYLDRGYDEAFAFVSRQYEDVVGGAMRDFMMLDYKTHLQEVTQSRFGRTPLYRVIEESGPDHDKHFVMEVALGDETYGRGEGRTKKEAEQRAAREATKRLEAEGGK